MSRSFIYLAEESTRQGRVMDYPINMLRCT